MLRRSGMHRLFGASALCALAGILLFTFCSKDNPVKPVEKPTWALTVDVLDGYSGKTLPKARVQYMDSTIDTASLANGQGRIKIEGLQPGEQSFVVTTSDTTLKYTASTIAAKSTLDSLGKLNDVAVTVKLFPLSGAISGKVQSQVNQLSAKANAAGVVVKISYDNPLLASASPVGFQTKTDSTGAFSFVGLPVATGLKVTIAPATVNAIDFKPDVYASPELVSGITVPMGTIVMRPLNAANFSQIDKLPLIISPNQVITVKYSDPLDSVSYATLEGVGASQTVKVNTSVKGNAISVTPAISLVDGAQYYLTIYAFGKAGGDTVARSTIIVNGGGLIDVASSNVLDGNKKAIDGLGLSDTMMFSFKANITSASATVLKAGIPVLVTTVTKDNMLSVIPQGNWEATTYTVKISAKLADSAATTASFSFEITTVGGLDFKSSNIYNPKSNPPSTINGLAYDASITVSANKDISSAIATLSQTSPSTPVPMSVIVKGSDVNCKPMDNLKPATSYTFAITIKTDEGETKSFTSTFITAGSGFYPVSDNIRFGNDPAKPVLNAAPNGVIEIIMSADIKDASAKITTGGTSIPVTVVYSNDTLKITPQKNLSEATAYDLFVSISSVATEGSGNGEVYNSNNSNFVTGFQVKNTYYPVMSNVRYNDDPAQPVLDFAPYSPIIIKMSGTVQTATALLTIAAGTVVNCDVVIATDTIRIVPQANLSVAAKYNLTINTKSTTGLTYNASFVNGLCVQNKIRVIASNVLTSDGLGVSTFPVTGTPYFVLSTPFDSTTIAISGTAPSFTLRTKGDTIFVDPVSNLAAATTYYINIDGKTKAGNAFAIDNSATATSFTTERDVYVVASNCMDAAGNSAMNFPIYGTMWAKFSEPLSTNLSKITWAASAAAVKLYGDSTKASYNADVRINGDTLFVTPIKSLVPIAFADMVGFKVKVQTATGKIAAAATDFTATVGSNGVFITYTNTKDNFGITRTDLGLQDTIKAVLNNDIAKINTAAFAGANLNGVATINDLKLNAGGDTLTLVPPIKLVNNTAYTISITNVDLKSGLKNQTVALSLGFTTAKGLRFVSANDMVNIGTYRPFAVTGDSIVLTFSEAIDINKPYSAGGIAAWAHAQYAWSNANKTVTIKGGIQDTLKAKAYEANPDYTLSGTADYGPITFTGFQASSGSASAVTLVSNTATDWVVTRPAINVHTIVGIELINTNLKEDANKEGLYVNTFNTKVSSLGAAIKAKDSLGLKDTMKLWFNRAVDSAKIFTAPYSYFYLQKAGAGAQLNYTMSISSDKKTVFIVPVDSLKQAAPPTGQSYTLTVQNVPALGLATTLAGGKVATYSLVFTTLPTTPTMLSKQVIGTLTTDTSLTANVRGKMIPYSPEIAKYMASGISSPVVAASQVFFYFTDICWNTNHNDSITGYQVAIKGYEGDWIELKNQIIPAKTYDKWNPGLVSNVIKVNGANLNLAAAQDLNGVAVLTRLQRPTGTTGYSNAADVFNYANVVSVKLRPIYDVGASGTFEYANDLYGAWSAPLSFADNVAPCDSDFVSLANMTVVANGGVQIADNFVSWNYSGAITVDSSKYIELTFPEDMDISTTPTITFGRGTAVAADYLASATTLPVTPSMVADNGGATPTKTGWQNSRTYRAYVKFPSMVDYYAGQLKGAAQPWKGYAYSISVAGMKDASGVSIQSYGAAGTADGSVDLQNGANSQVMGPASLAGWRR